MTQTKKNERHTRHWIAGLVTAAATFALLYFGVSEVLDNEVLPGNLIAYGTFSLIAGAVIILFVRFRLYAATTLFLLGLAIGFIQMYRMFYTDADGWGDLTGLMSFIVLSVMGLVAGLLLQLIWYLVGYTRKGRKDKVERMK
ncbi:MAG: hypothetical protein AB9835_12380 [Eubacteriales bacterium]